MINARDIIEKFLTSHELEVIKGINGKYVQNQGKDNGEWCYGCYGRDGYLEKYVYTEDEALDYIGMEENDG